MRAIFETNFFGVVRLNNALLPAMRRRGRGRIIHVGSLAAWVGEPGEAFYSASKSALARYSEALRYELLPLGLYVSLVEPGAFRTNILAAAMTSDASIGDYDQVREATRRTMQSALRRGGDPEVAAKRILEAVRDRTPRGRYPAGAEAVWLPILKAVLPGVIFDELLIRAYGLRRRT